MDEYKKLLPPEFRCSLPDEVLDDLIDKQAMFINVCSPSWCSDRDLYRLAALIELKERRANDGRETDLSIIGSNNDSNNRNDII